MDGLEMGGERPSPEDSLALAGLPRMTERAIEKRGIDPELDLSDRGFTVRRLGSAQPLPEPCPYCAGPLHTPLASWYCELAGLIAASEWRGCKCNACLWSLDTRARRGRPRVHCGSITCKRAHSAKTSRESRQRRKLLAAA